MEDVRLPSLRRPSFSSSFANKGIILFHLARPSDESAMKAAKHELRGSVYYSATGMDCCDFDAFASM